MVGAAGRVRSEELGGGGQGEEGLGVGEAGRYFFGGDAVVGEVDEAEGAEGGVNEVGGLLFGFEGAVGEGAEVDDGDGGGAGLRGLAGHGWWWVGVEDQLQWWIANAFLELRELGMLGVSKQQQRLTIACSIAPMRGKFHL